MTLRPKTRGDCQVEGLCPFVGCRHHIFIDATANALHSSRKLAISRRVRAVVFEPWAEAVAENVAEAAHTCSLDIADEGTHTLTQVGAILGVTRERVRQIEDKALAKLAKLRGLGLELREAHQETADANSRSGALADE